MDIYAFPWWSEILALGEKKLNYAIKTKFSVIQRQSWHDETLRDTDYVLFLVYIKKKLCL